MDYSDANGDMLTSTPRVRMMLSLKAGMVKAPKYWMPSPVKIWAPALNHTGSCERESHFSLNRVGEVCQYMRTRK